MARGILLTNLGSPEAPDVPAVRRYLDEFLMDPYVVDLPWPLRRLLVSGVILPTRPAKSARAYASIWSEAGSPLLVHTAAAAAGVAERTGLPVEWAMRYGQPDFRSAISRLLDQGIDELLIMPLYPQYAMSTTRTTEVAVTGVLAELAPTLPRAFLPPFHADPRYVALLAEMLLEYRPADCDHVLFSYHGLPERHLRKTDPSGAHCLQTGDCCRTPHAAHATCYRHQTLATTAAVAEAAGLAADSFSTSFQSRLGRQPWLRPYTDHELQRLAQAGVASLTVICPAFVTDNLETLEEIAIQGNELFRAAGGQRLTLVPCLNARPGWLDLLSDWSTGEWPMATPV